jgi:hypothetical protein
VVVVQVLTQDNKESIMARKNSRGSTKSAAKRALKRRTG